MQRLGWALQRSQTAPISRALQGGCMAKQFSSGYSGNVKGKKKSTEEIMFAAENLDGISKIEQARMKVTYGLLKEHVTAANEGLPPPNPQENPMIDPRSFDVKQLPEIPAEVLKAFRHELPSKIANNVRPVPTQALWEPSEEEDGDKMTNLVATNSSEWAAVDERTMEHRQFSKMQRQALRGLGAQVSPPPAAVVKTKRHCVLSDARGRVNIDFRAVGKISTFVSEGGKLFHRRRTGLSAKAQRKLSRSVKSARQMALIAPDPVHGPTMEELRELYKDLL